MEINELDIVKLKKPRPDLGITSDNEGTVVYVHNNGEAYTVEFFDDNNETIDESIMTEFYPDELELVCSARLNIGIKR